MTRLGESSAYAMLRALLRDAGLNVRDLQARLAAAGFDYSYDALVSWGRPGRGLPQNPDLLLAIAHALLGPPRSRRSADHRQVVNLLLTAGLPHALLSTLADLLPAELLRELRVTVDGRYSLQGALGTVVSLPPSAGGLPPGSRPPPFAPNPLFCGRDVLLAQIATLLDTGHSVVLTGIGGTGKTQLAAELAFRYGRSFDGGVFWLRGDDIDAIPGEVAACGGANGLALHPRFDELPLPTQLRLVQTAWSAPVVRLIVLDNAEDVAAVITALPPPGGCRLLVTSQRARWPAHTGLHSIPVPPLAREHSVKLLQALLTDARVATVSLERLAGLLGDLPLAIHLAGSTLSQELAGNPEALPALINLLEAPSPAWPKNLSGVAPTPTCHDKGLSQALDQALQRLDPAEPTDRAARLLLAIIACLALSAPTPRELLMRCALPAPPENLSGRPPLPEPIPNLLRRSYDRLLSLGLLTPASGDGAHVHQLVVRRGRALPESAHTWENVAEQLMVAAHRYDGDPPTQRVLLPHLRGLAEAAQAERRPQAWRLWRWLGWTLVLLGRYVDGQSALRRALDLLSAQHAPSHPDLREAVCCLALAYQFDDHFREAWPLWERYITAEQELLVPEDPAYGLALSNAGLFFALAGAPGRAAPLLREALRQRVALYGWHDENTIRSLRNLAWLAVMSGRYHSAARYARAVQGLLAALEAPPSNLLGSTCWLLGEALLGQSKLMAAREAYQTVLGHWASRYRSTNEADEQVADQQVGLCLLGLARVALAANECGAARRLLMQALRIFQLTLGSDGLETARTRALLALMDAQEGLTSLAITELVRVLAICRDRYARPHPDIAEVLLIRGQILRVADDSAGANEAFAAAEAELQAAGLHRHPLMYKIELARGSEARRVRRHL